MKEEIRPLIYKGIEIPGYYVSNFGDVYTTIKPKKNIFGRWDGIYFTENKISMKLQKKLNHDGTCEAMRINIRVPQELVEDDYQKTSKTSYKVKMCVHKMVMDTFKPIMKFPPERLKPFWKDTPHEVKKYISECIIIHHIDHDPTNNKLDNLIYVTPRENSREAKAFYGGNAANKSKVLNKKQMITEENKISVLDFV